MNITLGYLAEVVNAIAREDLDGLVNELRNRSMEFGAAGKTALQMHVDNIIVEIEDIKDNIVPTLLRQVVSQVS